MVNLTRPDGAWAGDLDMSRRRLSLALAGGYALAAFSAEAQPVHTDEAGLVAGNIAFKAADRMIPGYLARPAAKGRHPVVLVYSEIFGVHEWVRDVCRRLAKAGYVALAPDFFVRHGEPAKLTDVGEIRKIVAQAADREITADTTAALAYLKAQAFTDPAKIAVTGFCWGGSKVWLAAERFPQIKAGCAWYGGLAAGKTPNPGTPAPIELAASLKAPVLGLYGGKDKGIPIADIAAMRAALKAAGKTSEIIVYPDAEHGFAADYRPSYNAAAAKDGWAKMLDHFAKHGVAPLKAKA